jgi:signal transduction histidine kinase
MHERAEAAGAQLTVTSQPGHGTELTIRWITPKETL